MKKQILLAFFSFICLTITAQTVWLGVKQYYIPVITQKGDTLISSIPEGNQWYKENVLIEGATSQTLIISEGGNYKVKVFYINSGCSSSSEIFTVKTGMLNNFSENFYCNVYPNPCKGIFNVKISSNLTGEVTMELFSLEGKSVMKEIFTEISYNKPVQFGNSGLINGAYTLRVQTDYGVITRLLIVY